MVCRLGKLFYPSDLKWGEGVLLGSHLGYGSPVTQKNNYVGYTIQFGVCIGLWVKLQSFEYGRDFGPTPFIAEISMEDGTPSGCEWESQE